MIVLDLGLPGLDGVEVCREVRTFSDAYVVMLTARSEEVDKLIGLSVGADDYMTKPFSPRELTARIQAMLRRPRPLGTAPDGPTHDRSVGTVDHRPGRSRRLARRRSGRVDPHRVRPPGRPVGATPDGLQPPAAHRRRVGTSLGGRRAPGRRPRRPPAPQAAATTPPRAGSSAPSAASATGWAPASDAAGRYTASTAAQPARVRPQLRDPAAGGPGSGAGGRGRHHMGGRLAVGPDIFHKHLMRPASTTQPSETGPRGAGVRLRRCCLDRASRWLAAVLAALAVSWYFSRRVQTLDRAGSQSPHPQIATGRYGARVADPGLGAEFGDPGDHLQPAGRTLGATESTRRRMLADLAHEMRTPLATIDAHLEALEDGIRHLDEDTLGSSAASTQRLRRLAEDITAVSRAEEGKLHISPQPVAAARPGRRCRRGRPRPVHRPGVRLDHGPRGRRAGASGRRPDGPGAGNLLDNACVTPPRAAPVTSPVGARAPGSSSPSPTRARESTPNTWTMSSTGSTGSTPLATATEVARGLGSVSPKHSSKPTAAESRPPALDRATARSSPSGSLAPSSEVRICRAQGPVGRCSSNPSQVGSPSLSVLTADVAVVRRPNYKLAELLGNSGITPEQVPDEFEPRTSAVGCDRYTLVSGTRNEHMVDRGGSWRRQTSRA